MRWLFVWLANYIALCAQDEQMLKNSLIEHIFYSCRGCVSVMILHLSFLNSHCSLVYNWYCNKLVISIHTSIYYYFVIIEYFSFFFFWNLTWKMNWNNFELRLYVPKCRTSRALWLLLGYSLLLVYVSLCTSKRLWWW